MFRNVFKSAVGGANVAASKARFSKTAVAAGAAGAAIVATAGVALANDPVLEAPEYGFEHKKYWKSFDAASVRRGYQVYKNVCATCHSMDRICYRNLVDVAYTDEEMKADAADIDVMDGPNDEGEMFERSGKLFDKLPSPYANEAAARYANNGAHPPDLSLIVKARGQGADYIHALLTGYVEPPSGVSIREGLHYNPYFVGGAIAMPQPLQDGQVEYDDGTDPTLSQMSKDVTEFLAWASEPEHDMRKLYGLKAIAGLSFIVITLGWVKRFRWNPVKNRRIEFTNNM